MVDMYMRLIDLGFIIIIISYCRLWVIIGGAVPVMCGAMVVFFMSSGAWD